MHAGDKKIIILCKIDMGSEGKHNAVAHNQKNI